MRNIYFFIALIAALTAFLLPAQAAGEKQTITNSLGMEFVLIKPGEFMMGSPESQPLRSKSEDLHKKKISKAFYMQTTEVTLGQWRAVMGRKWLFPRKGPYNYPVSQVSWYNCQYFIKKLNRATGETYRLPSEAEWEYACRAGTQSAYFWGNDIDCTMAMYGNHFVKINQCVDKVKAMGLKPDNPAPVKSYKPNPWGLYDMHGNVWEWCSDCFDKYIEPGDRGNFECVRRVRRGGSWHSKPRSLRSANRAYAHPAAKFSTTGFRLVKEAD